METRLTISNEALILVGERRLVDLDENVESRYLLEDVWNTNPIKELLERADWNFSMKSVRISDNTAIELEFGYQNVFDKPEDLIRVSGMFLDEHQNVPLTDYRDEGKYFFADVNTIYVHYITDAVIAMSDYSSVPRYFLRLVALKIAMGLAPRLKNFSGHELLEKKFKVAMREARSMDAMKQPSKRLPQGSWTGVRSRYSNRHSDPSRY